MTPQYFLNKVLEECMLEIQSNMERYGINASGRTSDSLHIVKYDGGIKLVSSGDKVAPFETTERGRKPGKVPYKFRDIIYQWSLDKGIDFEDDKERMSFAGAVAARIAKKGTLRYFDHSQRHNIFRTPVKQAIGQIKSGIAGTVLSTIKLSK